MKRIIITQLILMLMPSLLMAQNQGGACHVYIVDVEKARKVFENFRPTGSAEADAKSLSAVQTVFPEFRSVFGEEQLTTKTYPFPGSNLVITASVYYTDESMASSQRVESMLVGVVVSDKAQRDAISAENNAVSEVTDNEHVDTVRAKKYLRVRGKLYLVGIECRRKERAKPK